MIRPSNRVTARAIIFEYIEHWYNRQRRHSALGYVRSTKPGSSHAYMPTIEALQHFGAHVYRTNENGAAAITTNGHAIRLDTMLP